MLKFIKEHSLSLVLTSILLIQTFVFTFTTYPDGNGNVQPGMSYWDWWLGEYMLSTLADSYGMILIVLLSKYFWEKGSQENSPEKE